jgi:hypothetical protein
MVTGNINIYFSRGVFFYFYLCVERSMNNESEFVVIRFSTFSGCDDLFLRCSTAKKVDLLGCPHLSPIYVPTLHPVIRQGQQLPLSVPVR